MPVPPLFQPRAPSSTSDSPARARALFSFHPNPSMNSMRMAWRRKHRRRVRHLVAVEVQFDASSKGAWRSLSIRGGRWEGKNYFGGGVPGGERRGGGEEVKFGGGEGPRRRGRGGRDGRPGRDRANRAESKIHRFSCRIQEVA